MTSQQPKICFAEPRVAVFTIQPLLLLKMELFVVRLMKWLKSESQQTPNYQDIGNYKEISQSFSAKRIQRPEGTLLANLRPPSLNFYDTQLCPYVVRVFMLLNQNHMNQTEKTSSQSQCKEEPKTNLNKYKQVFEVPSPLIYVPDQSQNSPIEQSKISSYNPNEPGLYYLKSSNKNPQTSLVNVDGDKRIIVQIKRDSNKMSNQIPNVWSSLDKKIQTQIQSSVPTYEGWGSTFLNANNLSSCQVFPNQGNTPQMAINIFQSNSHKIEHNLEVQHCRPQPQSFSLVQQTPQTSQISNKYFSFGKITQSSQKVHENPYKILESNKEELTQNNEDAEHKKQDVVSFKRANVGDSLPKKGPLMGNFNQMMNQRDEMNIDEREEFQRIKTQKRKKETRQLYLGEDDPENGKSLSGTTAITSSFQTQYKLGSFNIPYAQYDANLSFPENRNHETSLLGLMRTKQENVLPNKSLESGEVQEKNLHSQSNAVNRAHYSERLDCQVQSYSILPGLIPSIQPAMGNLMFNHNHNLQSIPQQTNNYGIQSSSLSRSLDQGSSLNTFFPTIHQKNLIEFLYFKEIQRQQNESEYTITQKYLDYQEKKTFNQDNQICSSQNFNELFTEFQNFIYPSKNIDPHDQNQQAETKKQSLSFDEISKNIQSKLYAAVQDIKIPDISSLNTQIKESLAGQARFSRNQIKWKLNYDLPVRVLINLMRKYQFKLNNELIQEALQFIGSEAQFNPLKSHHSLSKVGSYGLIDHISQISCQNLNKLLKDIHTETNKQLTQIYYSINKTVNEQKINQLTGKVDYPKKQQLHSSNLSLYQYIQNCIINSNKIAKDPFYNAYNYDLIISDSLKRLIWINQIDQSVMKSQQSHTNFKQIFQKPHSQGKQFSVSVRLQDPAKMILEIIKYFQELDYLSFEINEKLDIIIGDLQERLKYQPYKTQFGGETSQLYQMQYLKGQTFLKKQFLSFSANSTNRNLSETQLYQNIPKNYLTEFLDLLQFTESLEKYISLQEVDSRKDSEFTEKNYKNFSLSQHQTKTQMKDEANQNKINEFISSIFKILSEIESDLQIMDQHLLLMIDRQI